MWKLLIIVEKRKKENSENYGRAHIHGQDTGKYQYHFPRHW